MCVYDNDDDHAMNKFLTHAFVSGLAAVPIMVNLDAIIGHTNY